MIWTLPAARPQPRRRGWGGTLRTSRSG